MLHHTSQHYTTVQHNASCCGTSEHTATHYNINTFQDVLFRARTVNSIHCKSLHHTCNTRQHTVARGNILQHAVAHYNTLQHTATEIPARTCYFGQEEQTRQHTQMILHRNPTYLTLLYVIQIANGAVMERVTGG